MSVNETIAIAGDHAAPELKASVIQGISEIEWLDLGTTSGDSVDYPDYAEKACRAIQNGKAQRAVLICGSGIGMCITANKFDGIRAAVVESVESARLSRDHNNANVLCIGARTVKSELALEIVKTWIKTPFSGGPRHQQRIDKISAIERGRKSS